LISAAIAAVAAASNISSRAQQMIPAAAEIAASDISSRSNRSSSCV